MDTTDRNHDGMYSTKRGTDDDVMTKIDLLLLPQREVKGILINKKAASFLNLINNAPSDTKSQIDSPIVNKISVTLSVEKLPSIFELTLIMKSIKATDMLFCHFCQYLSIIDVLHLSLLNKRCYDRMVKGALKMPISMKAFIRFVSSYTEKWTNGLMESNQLCISDNDCVDLGDWEVNQFTNYLISTKGGVDYHSISVKILQDVSFPSISAFIASMNTPILLKLQHLNLSGSLIGLNGMQLLNDLIKQDVFPELRTLRVDRNRGQDLGVKGLRLALMQNHCPLLESLDVSGNSAPISVLDLFAYCFVNARYKLNNIVSQSNGIDLTDDNLNSVITKGQLMLSHLVMLDLSYNPLTDSGFLKLMKAAWPLKKCQVGSIKLRELVLDYTSIANLSIIYLSELFTNGTFNEIIKLSVGGNDITADGLTHLLKSITCIPSLTGLSLQLNNLGSEGVMHCIGAAINGKTFRSLEFLDISDVGAKCDACNQLLRTISTLDEVNALYRLKTIKIYGSQPYCAPQYRCVLPSKFTRRVSISDTSLRIFRVKHQN